MKEIREIRIVVGDYTSPVLGWIDVDLDQPVEEAFSNALGLIHEEFVRVGKELGKLN